MKIQIVGIRTESSLPHHGASWYDDPPMARVTIRDWYSPLYRGSILGLRLLMVLQ